MDDISSQAGSRENLSSLHGEPDALSNTTTATATSATSISANIEDELLITSTSPNLSTASASSIPSSTFSPLSSSTLFAELNLSPPPMDDRLFFNGIDVSGRFYDFQLDVNNRLQQNTGTTIEEHVQHLLALSSVLLLKPGRTHEDLHKHIDLNTCEALRRHILSEPQGVHLPFPAAIKEWLEEIMEQMDTVILEASNLAKWNGTDFLSYARAMIEMTRAHVWLHHAKSLPCVKDITEGLFGIDEVLNWATDGEW